MFFGPLSIGSLDHALVTYRRRPTSIEGGFATFNAIEIHQAKVRIADSIDASITRWPATAATAPAAARPRRP